MILLFQNEIVAASTQVEIINIWPHNASAFTEGLFFHEGSLMESTGLNGKSVIRELDFESFERNPIEKIEPNALPKIKQEFHFPSEYFGEGIAILGDRLFSLTYKAKEIFILSRSNFTLLGKHKFETTTGEGWGLTTNGRHLIVSDGSSTISFYDPNQDFKLIRKIQVTTKEGQQITNINELEFVENEILANVWFQDVILRIDPATGKVIETIDFGWLRGMVTNFHTLPNNYLHDAVLNGIAFNPSNRHVYLTGKLWDSLFELEFSYLANKGQGKTGRGIHGGKQF